MNKAVLQSDKKFSGDTLHLGIAAICTAALLFAALTHLPHAVQLIAYIALLAVNCRRLLGGFSSLAACTPTADSLLLLSAFSALLHGLASLDDSPYYACVSLAMLSVKIGDRIGNRSAEIVGWHKAPFFYVCFTAS